MSGIGRAGRRAAGLIAWLTCMSSTARADVEAPAASGPVEPPADESAAGLLAQAEAAMTGIEFDRSRRLAEQAINRGGLDLDEVRRAYTLLAVSCVQLEDAACARPAFLRLYAVDPQSRVLGRLSPARRG